MLTDVEFAVCDDKGELITQQYCECVRIFDTYAQAKALINTRIECGCRGADEYTVVSRSVSRWWA
ncbi:hypothetical protein SEA_CHASER_122 [Mycobacterium phage Chaser]|nr:hypothetical protein SEA_CHASER_122 [Mycobacterium phage Chaser]